MPTSFESRFIAQARADAQGFTSTVRDRFGHAPAFVSQMLRAAGRLSGPGGGTLTKNDVAAITQAHPGIDPHYIASVAAKLNEAQGDRGAHLLALLSGDQAAVQGDYVNAGSDFKELQALSRDFTLHETVDAINAKAGGVEDAPPAWKPEAGSVRAMLEQQYRPKGEREFSEALARGDGHAHQTARAAVVEKMGRATDVLESGEASTRDAVAAAFNYHQGEAVAADQWGETDSRD
jgi:hypothetical protein